MGKLRKEVIKFLHCVKFIFLTMDECQVKRGTESGCGQKM
jgi:hypothetical protein